MTGFEHLTQHVPQIAEALGALEGGRRVFGPTLDLIGDTLQGYVGASWPLRNIRRVVDAAAAKSAGQPDDAAPALRASVEILRQAAVAEDEVMADYLGGVLASARAGGTDDAVVWTSLIGRMSSAELHVHYTIHAALREAALVLRDALSDLSLGNSPARSVLQFFIPYDGSGGLLHALGEVGAPETRLDAACFGLLREDLLDRVPGCAWGQPEEISQVWPGARDRGIVATPSVFGVSLFLWGHGVGHRGLDAFLDPGLDLTGVSEIAIPTASLCHFTV